MVLQSVLWELTVKLVQLLTHYARLELTVPTKELAQ
jgi:hypothetical protein